MKTFITTGLLIIFFNSALFSFQNKETIVLIKTSMGDIKIKLSNKTPKHRDNFIKLVNQKYYDSLLFHRVIKDFMIQTGDPNSKNAPLSAQLGNGGPRYTIPAEFDSALIHKKGAVAAARSGDDVNPLKASSGSQFYIVVGQVYSDKGLSQIENKLNENRKKNQFRDYLNKPENKSLRNKITGFQKAGDKIRLDSIGQIVAKLVEEKYKNEPPVKFSEYQKQIYKSTGGTPFLDMNYTVFGEVVEGLDIVDKIAASETMPGDRPKTDIIILSARVVQ